MNFRYKIFFIFIAILNLSCSNSQTINKISCYSGGGEVGISVYLEITKDSTVGYYKKYNEKTKFREETNPAFWNSLTHEITVNDFKKINSTESRTYIDEPDSSVRITTDQDEYSIMNGEINQDKDKNMYNFMTSLWEKQQEIYDKYK